MNRELMEWGLVGWCVDYHSNRSCIHHSGENSGDELTDPSLQWPCFPRYLTNSRMFSISVGIVNEIKKRKRVEQTKV